MRNWLITASLAFNAYVGYFLRLAGADVYAGPVIAPAFLGPVPIALTIVSNIRQASMPWRSLSIPLALVIIGVLLVNWNAVALQSATTDHSLWIGVLLAMGAVVSLTHAGSGILNQVRRIR